MNFRSRAKYLNADILQSFNFFLVKNMSYVHVYRLKPYLVAQYLINHETRRAMVKRKYVMKNKTQMIK